MTKPNVLGTDFDALKASIPLRPDQEPIDSACELLDTWNLKQLKKLEFYGLGRIFGKIVPHIPNFDNPEHPEFRDIVANAYTQHDRFMFLKADRPATLIELATRSLRCALEDSFVSGLGEVDDRTFVTIRTLHEDRYARIASNPLSRRRINMASRASNDDIGYALRMNLFGAATLILMDLLSNKSKNPDKLTATELKGVHPEIQKLLVDPQAALVMRRHANIDLDMFNTLFASGLLSKWIDGSSNATIVDTTYKPPVSSVIINEANLTAYSVEDISSIRVGCPATWVKGAISWAPRALLAGCLAVAEAESAASSL